jgi:hypothetical protein
MACEPWDLCNYDSTPWADLELAGNRYSICQICTLAFENLKKVIISDENYQEFKHACEEET